VASFIVFFIPFSFMAIVVYYRTRRYEALMEDTLFQHDTGPQNCLLSRVKGYEALMDDQNDHSIYDTLPTTHGRLILLFSILKI
jgi:hypothetical protein